MGKNFFLHVFQTLIFPLCYQYILLNFLGDAISSVKWTVWIFSLIMNTSSGSLPQFLLKISFRGINQIINFVKSIISGNMFKIDSFNSLWMCTISGRLPQTVKSLIMVEVLWCKTWNSCSAVKTSPCYKLWRTIDNE